MELPPGQYGFADLSPGDEFWTAWVEISQAFLANYAKLAGMEGAPKMAPPLSLLARIEGAKAAGPVQIRAVAVLSWDFEAAAPVPCGSRLRGRYTVSALRAAGPGRGVITLDLSLQDRQGETVLSGQTRLTMARS